MAVLRLEGLERLNHVLRHLGFPKDRPKKVVRERGKSGREIEEYSGTPGPRTASGRLHGEVHLDDGPEDADRAAEAVLHLGKNAIDQRIKWNT